MSTTGERFRFRGQNIVCFSTADWDTPLPTNKHHLMRRLARRGARVLFCETLGTRAPRLGSRTDLRRIFRRVARSLAGARQRERRLWTISPLVRPSWKSSLEIALNKTTFSALSHRALDAFPRPIVWIYSPYACHFLDLMRPRLVVYHMVDDLSAVPGADRDAIREAEMNLLSRADVVFCTERSLYDRARRVASRAFFLPNVADYDHFSRRAVLAGQTRLAQLRALPRPRIVFSGNMAPHKVDLNLIRELSAARPHWQFILIGPAWEGAEAKRTLEALARRSNVTWLGHVDYEAVPSYLHEADALIIPYVRNDATRAVFPLKFYEYMAVGKPIVASPLPSLLPFRGAIRLADSTDEWLEQLEAALRDPHELAAQRRALARRNTWDIRLGEMERELGRAIEERYSRGE